MDIATYEDTIVLRRARMNDVPALTRLMEQSIRVLQAGDYTSEQIESALKYIYGMDTLLIHDGTYFVAECDGDPVGCGGWSRRRMLYGGDQRRGSGEDDTEVLDPTHEAARIRAFFVDPDWARRGIGRMLLEASEKAAYAAGYRNLELVATRTGVHLYAACGYTIAEPVSTVLPDGVPMSGYRMTKSLHA
jgi:GNAT superfamily N-acetyltransferase